MPTIEHSSIIDIRDLAELATECGSIIEASTDEDSEPVDAEELEEAKETLAKLAKLAEDLGRSVNAEDADDVASELEYYGDSIEPTLISEGYFEDYCKELVSDLGYLPDSLPDFISSNIDWAGVASDLQQDYTNIKFDGEDYLIR
jgi:hypothetical protein